MSAVPNSRYTPEQYLEMDRQADHRSEYVNGEILAMAGASRIHNLIVTNIVREVSTRLRGRPCETYSNDMRVKISPVRYTYPDVVVACDQPQFTDSHLETLTNPIVVLEVLSPSTETDDRGWKFAHYRQLATLTDYLLVSQDKPFVEHYTRQTDNQWILTELSGLDAVLRLPSLDCELPLSEIYERVEFSPDPTLPPLHLNEDTAPYCAGETHLTITLTPDLETALRQRAKTQGTTPEQLALDSLRQIYGTLEPTIDDRAEEGKSLYDFLKGHIGTIAGSTEAFSESGGERFAQGLVEKRQTENK